MKIGLYEGISKPESKTKLQIDSPLCSIANIFSDWEAFAKEQSNINILLAKATELLMPCANSLDTIIDNEFPFIHKNIGVFYTALLNAGAAKRVILTQLSLDNNLYGYGLKSGILEIQINNIPLVGSYGDCCRGGIIINRKYNNVIMGWCAEGGTFINFGTGHLGIGAIKGLFINCGVTYGPLAWYALPGAVYLDKMPRQHWQVLKPYPTERYLFNSKHRPKLKCNATIVHDKTLTTLCKELKTATATKDVVALSNGITEHCKIYQ